MKNLLTIALALLLPVFGYAQSIPNGAAITAGQVWTVPQWTNAWQSKTDTTNGILNGVTSTNGTFNNPILNGGTLNGSAINGNLSTSTAVATSSTTARTLANRFSQVYNVKDWGAKGDCVTDDSAAIAAAMSAANAVPKGLIPTVYFPAACYVLGSGSSLPLMTHPVHMSGDGTHKTYLSISTSYVGDVFSFSEIWQGSSYVNGMLPTADNAGITVTGISVFGNKTSTNVNNAIAFYDRDNFAVVRDFEAFYLNGSCIFTGHNKTQTRSYVRESLFYNVRCNNTGTAGTAAVDISSTTVSGDDATDELQFFGLNVFQSAGVGIAIRNPNNFNATRDIKFFGPRVEFSAGDNIQIGSSGDAGQVQGIRMYDVESHTPGQTNDGAYGINIDTTGPTIYDVLIQGGEITPCWLSAQCKGIHIGNVRLSKIALDNISVAGTAVTYETTTGANVTLDVGGQEQSLSYSIPNSTVAKLVRTPVYKYGDPSTASGAGNPPAITSSYHDGSSTFGSSPGTGAVDLQNFRNSAGQVASGAGACLIAGGFSTASASGSCVIGGSTQSATGTNGVIIGGQNASDRGRSNSQAFSAGQLAVAGDAQAAHFVLSQTCSSCSSVQLTANHGTANAANVANIFTSQSYAMTWRCIARDVTTAGTDNATLMPIMLMSRDTGGVASTAVVIGTPATATRGTWTGGGFAFSADTTNGGANIAFTSPTGNTDTFHTVCEGHDVETQ